jgi:tetratricopeptide (TPR) repeat protein
MDVLGTAGPGAEPRHRTLRAAIDWSYRLLDEPERAVLRRCSVLRGGGELEAVLAICADPEGPPPHEPRQVVEALGRLVDQSMLVASQESTDTRYRMLELVREYAAERLTESGEWARARTRHARWYSRLIGTTSMRVQGAEHARWAARLQADHDNLLAGLVWYLDDGMSPERALNAAASLWRYWWMRGRMSEGRAWLQRALDAAGPTPSRPRVLALRAAAALSRIVLDHEEARALGEEALATALTIGDDRVKGACLNELCMIACAQGDTAASLRYGEESVAWAEQIGDQRGLASSRANMAATLRVLGRLEESEALYEEALAETRKRGDMFPEAVVLNTLAVLARLLGQRARSRQLCQQSIAVYRKVQSRQGVLDVMDSLACLEADEGNPEAALRLLAVTGRERERIGHSKLYSILSDQDRELREQALAAAASALGPKAAEVRAAAAAIEVEDLV